MIRDRPLRAMVNENRMFAGHKTPRYDSRVDREKKAEEEMILEERIMENLEKTGWRFRQESPTGGMDNLDWRLEYGYVTHGDVDTDEAKQYVDLTHLLAWQFRYNLAANSIEIPGDALGSDDKGRRIVQAFAAMANPALLAIWAKRWHAQAEQAKYRNDASGLQPKIDAYIKANGGNRDQILAMERTDRLDSGYILMPDLIISDPAFTWIPGDVVRSRCTSVANALHNADATVFAEDIKYWQQLEQWTLDYNLPGPQRRDGHFYDSTIFNPAGLDPRGLQIKHEAGGGIRV